MNLPNKYVSPYHPIGIIITKEIELLEGEENEIYFYTTIETAQVLDVGHIHLIKGKQILIGSIETRLSGHLPRADGKLFFYAPQKEFEDVVGKREWAWAVLVSGEIIR